MFEYEVEDLAEVKRKEIEKRQRELFLFDEKSPIKGFDKKGHHSLKPGNTSFDCSSSFISFLQHAYGRVQISENGRQEVR